MTCRDIQKLIPLYLDNQLKDNELQMVKGHIANCPHCQKEVGLYEKSWDMLKGWQDVEPSPGYVSRFWSRLAAEKSFSEKVIEGIRTVFEKRQFAGALAAASVVVIVGLVSLRNSLPIGNAESMLSKMKPEELELVSNLELAQNLEVIENIDILEDLEVLENLDSLES